MFQFVFTTAIWNVQTSVGRMNFAGSQATSPMTAAHIQRLAIVGLSYAQGMRRYVATTAGQPYYKNDKLSIYYELEKC